MKIYNNVDEEPGKMFVGGLSWETTKEKLQAYFCRFGEVVDCVVMKNTETGKSRGFGFVCFKDAACVTTVLESGPHELDGRKIDPKSCTPRGAQRVKKQSPSKIFLGGLPSNCTESELRDFFSQYGPVQDVVIMYDQDKKKSRGFGFLSFESEESTVQVCSEHFVNINGKQVECKRAEPKEKSKTARARALTPGTAQDQQWSSQWNNWSPAAPQYLPAPTAAITAYPGWNSANYGYGTSGTMPSFTPAPQAAPTPSGPNPQSSAFPAYPPTFSYPTTYPTANYPTNQPSPMPVPPPPVTTQSSSVGSTEYPQDPSHYRPVSSSTTGYFNNSNDSGPTRVTMGQSQAYHPYRR